MIEARSQNNLPMGIVVNRTTVTQQNLNLCLLLLLNTNSYNVWIWQSLLAADIVEVEYCPWDFHSIMSRDGDQVQVSFCPVPMLEVQEEVLSFGVTETKSFFQYRYNANMSTKEEQGERPKFGPHPKFDSLEF